MKLISVALLGAFAVTTWAQTALTAEDVIEKSIAAAGGRQAIQKITSTVGKGKLDVPSAGVSGTFEIYAKAPDKRLIVATVEGWGVLRRGCDGPAAWEDHPTNGFRSLEGPELEETLLGCVFDPDSNWKKLFPKFELAGKEKAGAREAYKVTLTSAKGKPLTRYIDAETFLPLAQVSTRATSQGPVEVRVELADYRELDGVKAAYQIKEITPGQEVVIQITELKNNVAVEDARFAKPGTK